MIFEWGNIYKQNKPGLKGIQEKLVISGVVHGYLNKPTVHRKKGRRFNFNVLKGSVKNLMDRLSIKNLTFNQTKSKERRNQEQKNQNHHKSRTESRTKEPQL